MRINPLLITNTTNLEIANNNNNENMVLLRLNSVQMYEQPEIVEQFKLLSNQLISMGFKPRIVNNCFRLHRFMSLSEAIDLLLMERDKYIHKFIVKEGSDLKLCDLCEERIEKHAEYIDLEKIERNQSQIRKLGSITSIEKIRSVVSGVDLELKIKRSAYMRNCEICMDEFDYSKLEGRFKLACEHAYCQSCIETHIETEITNGKVKQFNCPYTNCNFEFPKDQILILIENKSDLQQKYSKFLKLREIEDNPDNIFCPYPDCEGFITYPNHKERVATMLTCQQGHDVCTRCHQLWHPDKKCEKQSDDEIEKQVLQKTLRLKKCPGCCNWTEKNTGCNHMTCVFCKMSWCWLCNKRYYPSHYLIPNTKCHGAQFPVNGQFEWEDHDPKIFEEARLHINDPEPQVPVSLHVEAHNRIVVRQIHDPSFYDYFKYLSPSLNRNDQVDSFKKFTYNLVKDIILFIILASFNCFGNLFFFILVWGNRNFMNQRFFQRQSLIFKINYFMTMVLLWIVYFISFVGFAIIAVGVYFTNSLALNLYRYAR
jgi:hypothetical protein